MTLPRWSKTDWAAHALAQLGQHGPERLTIEALCESAGRTRGSLYHHFGDHESLLLSTVAHWRATHTDALIDTIRSSGARGIGGAYRLNDLATSLDFGIEVGIRRLAARHPALRASVLEADEARIAFLAELYRESEHSPDEALALAQIEYAAFVGVQHLSPLFTLERLTELYAYLEQRTRP